MVKARKGAQASDPSGAPRGRQNCDANLACRSVCLYAVLRGAKRLESTHCPIQAPCVDGARCGANHPSICEICGARPRGWVRWGGGDGVGRVFDQRVRCGRDQPQKRRLGRRLRTALPVPHRDPLSDARSGRSGFHCDVPVEHARPCRRRKRLVGGGNAGPTCGACRGDHDQHGNWVA